MYIYSKREKEIIGLSTDVHTYDVGFAREASY